VQSITNFEGDRKTVLGNLPDAWNSQAGSFHEGLSPECEGKRVGMNDSVSSVAALSEVCGVGASGGEQNNTEVRAWRQGGAVGLNDRESCFEQLRGCPWLWKVKRFQGLAEAIDVGFSPEEASRVGTAGFCDGSAGDDTEVPKREACVGPADDLAIHPDCRIRHGTFSRVFAA
jgi:hypothetical protein